MDDKSDISKRKARFTEKKNKINKAGTGKTNEDYGVERLIGEGVAKKMNKGDALSSERREKIEGGKSTAGMQQKMSISWKVTAIRQTPDEILEKVFREGSSKKDTV